MMSPIRPSTAGGKMMRARNLLTVDQFLDFLLINLYGAVNIRQKKEKMRMMMFLD